MSNRLTAPQRKLPRADNGIRETVDAASSGGKRATARERGNQNGASPRESEDPVFVG